MVLMRYLELTLKLLPPQVSSLMAKLYMVRTSCIWGEIIWELSALTLSNPITV